MLARKHLLAQPMVGIRILPVMRGAKGYSLEIRRLLSHSPGAQDVGVGSFDNGRPAGSGAGPDRRDDTPSTPYSSVVIKPQGRDAVATVWVTHPWRETETTRQS